MVTITETEFDTHVVHRTGVHPLGRAFTHRSDTVHENEDVLGLFVVPIKRTVEGLFEEGEVKTNIRLGCCLPLDIVVTYLVAFETGRQSLTTVRAGNVVGSTVRLTS